MTDSLPDSSPDSLCPPLAFFAPPHRQATAEALAEACRAQGWAVSCCALSRVALADAFVRGCAVVGWCPPAVLIRALPVMDKHHDSPVLCFPPMSGDGQSVLLALLGWHHGGRRVAQVLKQTFEREGDQSLLLVGGSATEARLGFSLEDLPRGWALLGEPDRVLKAIARSLARGENTGNAAPSFEIVGEAFDGFPPPQFFDLCDKKHNAEQSQKRDTETLRMAVGISKQQEADLQLVPRCVVAGIGCARGASCDEIASLFDACLEEAGIESTALAGIASVVAKRDEVGLLRFAESRGLPLRFFSSEYLSRVCARYGLAGEQAVERAVGTPSVAEAAALALVESGEGSGASARLLLAKRKSSRATCALALAPRVLPKEGLVGGESNGILTLVGLGPGRVAERTAAAALALREAECVVGYEGYVALLEEGETHAECMGFAIGSEEERCRKALALAREGKRTALLGSGDAGVYGLATLVWQILAQENLEEKNTDSGTSGITSPPVEVRQVCGVSAMHAFAARLGAPLADDFCAVSLSDVMTAEGVVLKRIEAAAAGDFVVALYNPQSRTRRSLLARALACLRAQRPAETPVAIGKNIGRSGEKVLIETLQGMSHKDKLDSVDMHSVVLIGNSRTKRYDSPYGTKLYTERGYKLEGAK